MFAPKFDKWDVYGVLLLCGVVGWVVIETLLWLFSFINISFGG